MHADEEILEKVDFSYNWFHIINSIYLLWIFNKGMLNNLTTSILSFKNNFLFYKRSVF